MTLNLGRECKRATNSSFAPRFLTLAISSKPVSCLLKYLTAGSVKSSSMFLDAAKSFIALLLTLTSFLSSRIDGSPAFSEAANTCDALSLNNKLRSLAFKILRTSANVYASFTSTFLFLK